MLLTLSITPTHLDYSVFLAINTGMNTNENLVFQQLTSDGFSREAAAGIMGVVAGESNFQTLKEIGYDTTPNSRIRAIFTSRVAHLNEEQLTRVKSSYTDFFNTVYGGMYGNAPNEGAKYVGRGFNQITFKGNYQNIKNLTGIDVVSNPELLERPEIAAKALSAYFKDVKPFRDFESAYKKAFVLNAGIAHSYEYYAQSTNPAISQGVKIKRQKAEEYLQKINSFVPGISNRTLFFFIADCSSTDILFSEKIQTAKSDKDIINTIKNIL